MTLSSHRRRTSRSTSRRSTSRRRTSRRTSRRTRVRRGGGYNPCENPWNWSKC